MFNKKNTTFYAGAVLSALAVFLTSFYLVGSPTDASAVVRKSEDILFSVDSSLIMEPAPVSFADGPLTRIAVTRVYDDAVRIQLEHLLTDKRADIHASLSLSTRYMEHILPILEKYDLPGELVYLCVIESGYRQSARSHAGAVGMWQMIRATSSRFGLRTDRWVDDRMDVLLSTEGAARFIRYLYDIFGDWDHVLAAYNAGEGRVKRAINKAKREGKEPVFENLRLPRETRIYVPAFYAALLIALEPERYGIFPDSQPPMDYIEMKIPGGVSLEDIAARAGCTVESIRQLNPSILKGRIPPNEEGYSLKLPCSVGERVAKKVAEAFNEVRYMSYKVKKGDTLWDISRRFGVSISMIDKTGSRKKLSSRIFPGEVLMVPIMRGGG